MDIGKKIIKDAFESDHESSTNPDITESKNTSTIDSHDNETLSHVNPTAPEFLDLKDNELLRGDAIGDTAYTHRWVLTCLLNITKVFNLLVF